MTRVERIFAQLSTSIPSPKTELVYTNTYTLLVAVVLSAQATDKGVNKVTKALFSQVKTPEDMIALGEDSLRDHIKSIGLYRTKAKHIMGLSRELILRYEGRVPTDRKSLESLPGVGRKTANVVLNEGFGEPTLAVDTHIFRVAHRLGLSKGKTPLAVEKDLMMCVPQVYAKEAHHLLILHGRYVCKARTPLCHNCPLRQDCSFQPA